MKCPYCGKEMQLGFIQCRDGVYWCEKKRPVAAVSLGGGKTINLGGNSAADPFSGDISEAWRCEECRSVIIEY